MNYNEIGKTGMRVSNLSFGASSLGGVFHDIREAEGIKAVYTAVENGMNFIDVSPYYGHYKAETVLGKALKETWTTLPILHPKPKSWVRQVRHGEQLSIHSKKIIFIRNV